MKLENSSSASVWLSFKIMLILFILISLSFFLCLKISLQVSLSAFFTKESFFCFDAFLQLLVIIYYSLSSDFAVRENIIELAEVFLISYNLSEAMCFMFNLFNWFWLIIVRVYIDVYMYSFSSELVILLQRILNNCTNESYFCFFEMFLILSNCFCSSWIFNFNSFIWALKNSFRAY